MAEKNNPMMGLFGMNPDMFGSYRQAQDEQAQVLAGRMAANPGTMMSPSLAPLYAQAQQQGTMIGRGIGGLFGVEDPMMKKAAGIDAATKAVQAMDIDMSDPKQLYPAMIKELQRRGLTDMALPLVKEYQSALSAESRTKYEEALAKKAEEGYEYKQDMLGNVSIFKNGQLVRQVPSPLMGTAQGAAIVEGLPGGKPGSPVVSVPDNQPYIFKDGKIAPNPNYKKPQ
jgi:hypothetical protein